MRTGFAGFPREGMKFLAALKKNNRREWFQPRKHIYEEQVKAPMLELVAAINQEMLRFAPEYTREAEQAVYRVYRDTRFSHDKTPYKTHIAAVFNRHGLSKHGGAGLYFAVSPDEIEIAGGVYMPSPEDLRAIRLHMLDHHKEFERIVKGRALRAAMGELRGESLTRVPKGFPCDHPAAELVRRKQWLLWVTLDPAIALTPELFTTVVRCFRVMAPFNEFLNTPLVGMRKKADARAFFA